MKPTETDPEFMVWPKCGADAPNDAGFRVVVLKGKLTSRDGKRLRKAGKQWKVKNITKPVIA